MKRTLCLLLALIMMLGAVLTSCGGGKEPAVTAAQSTGTTASVCAHNATEIRNAVPATCAATGYSGDVWCTECQTLILRGTDIPKLTTHGHTELRNVQPATIEADGYSGDTYCTVCGELLFRGEVLLRLKEPCQHEKTRLVHELTATCHEPGYTGDTICLKCGETVATGSVIAQLQHIWQDDAHSIVTKNATCTELGVRTICCTLCGDEKTQTIEATGIHSYRYRSAGQTQHIKYCVTCDTVSIPEPHTPKDDGTYHDATCTMSAYTEYTCAKCGQIYSVADPTHPALGHSYESETTKTATCIDTGTQHFYCTHEGCDSCYDEELAIVENAHTWEWVIRKNATCTEEGVRYKKCLDCQTEGEDEVIPKTPHRFGEASVDPSTGITTRICLDCSYELKTFDAKDKVEVKLETSDLDKEKGLEVEMKEAAIEMPTDVLGGLGEGDLTLTADKVDKSTLPQSISQDDLAAIGDRNVYNFGVQVGDDPVSEFDGKIKVTLPYVLGDDEDPDGVLIYYINGEGEIETFTAVWDAETQTVTFETEHFSMYAIAYVETQEIKCRRGIHDWGEAVTVAATCSHAGYDVQFCKCCGSTLVSNYQPMKAHEYGDVHEPDTTCSGAGGYKTQTCGKCGYVMYLEYCTPADHVFHGFPTCEENVSCEVCHKVIIPKLGHDWTPFTVVVEATETTPGLCRRYCLNCGEKEEYVIDPTDGVEPIPLNSYDDLMGYFTDALIAMVGTGPVHLTIDIDDPDENMFDVKSIDMSLSFFEEDGKRCFLISGNIEGNEDGETAVIEILYRDGMFTIAMSVANADGTVEKEDRLCNFEGLTEMSFDLYLANAEAGFYEIDPIVEKYLTELRMMVEQYTELYSALLPLWDETEIPVNADTANEALDAAETLYAFLVKKLGFRTNMRVRLDLDEYATDEEAIRSLFDKIFVGEKTENGTEYSFALSQLTDGLREIMETVEEEKALTVAEMLYEMIGEKLVKTDETLTDWAAVVALIKTNINSETTLFDLVDELITLAEESGNFSLEGFYTFADALLKAMEVDTEALAQAYGMETFTSKAFVEMFGSLTLEQMIESYADIIKNANEASAMQAARNAWTSCQVELLSGTFSGNMSGDEYTYTEGEDDPSLANAAYLIYYSDTPIGFITDREWNLLGVITAGQYGQYQFTVANGSIIDVTGPAPEIPSVDEVIDQFSGMLSQMTLEQFLFGMFGAEMPQGVEDLDTLLAMADEMLGMAESVLDFGFTANAGEDRKLKDFLFEGTVVIDGADASFALEFERNDDLSVIPELSDRMKEIKPAQNVKSEFDADGNLIVTGLDADDTLILDGSASVSVAPYLELDQAMSAAVGEKVYRLKEQYWADTKFFTTTYIEIDGKIYSYRRLGDLGASLLESTYYINSKTLLDDYLAWLKQYDPSDAELSRYYTFDPEASPEQYQRMYQTPFGYVTKNQNGEWAVLKNGVYSHYCIDNVKVGNKWIGIYYFMAGKELFEAALTPLEQIQNNLTVSAIDINSSNPFVFLESDRAVRMPIYSVSLYGVPNSFRAIVLDGKYYIVDMTYLSVNNNEQWIEETDISLEHLHSSSSMMAVSLNGEYRVVESYRYFYDDERVPRFYVVRNGDYIQASIRNASGDPVYEAKAGEPLSVSLAVIGTDVLHAELLPYYTLEDGTVFHFFNPYYNDRYIGMDEGEDRVLYGYVEKGNGVWYQAILELDVYGNPGELVYRVDPDGTKVTVGLDQLFDLSELAEKQEDGSWLIPAEVFDQIAEVLEGDSYIIYVNKGAEVYENVETNIAAYSVGSLSAQKYDEWRYNWGYFTESGPIVSATEDGDLLVLSREPDKKLGFDFSDVKIPVDDPEYGFQYVKTVNGLNVYKHVTPRESSDTYVRVGGKYYDYSLYSIYPHIPYNTTEDLNELIRKEFLLGDLTLTAFQVTADPLDPEAIDETVGDVYRASLFEVDSSYIARYYHGYRYLVIRDSQLYVLKGARAVTESLLIFDSICPVDEYFAGLRYEISYGYDNGDLYEDYSETSDGKPIYQVRVGIYEDVEDPEADPILVCNFNIYYYITDSGKKIYFSNYSDYSVNIGLTRYDERIVDEDDLVQYWNTVVVNGRPYELFRISRTVEYTEYYVKLGNTFVRAYMGYYNPSTGLNDLPGVAYTWNSSRIRDEFGTDYENAFFAYIDGYYYRIGESGEIDFSTAYTDNDLYNEWDSWREINPMVYGGETVSCYAASRKIFDMGDSVGTLCDGIAVYDIGNGYYAAEVGDDEYFIFVGVFGEDGYYEIADPEYFFDDWNGVLWEFRNQIVSEFSDADFGAVLAEYVHYSDDNTTAVIDRSILGVMEHLGFGTDDYPELIVEYDVTNGGYWVWYYSYNRLLNILSTMDF